MPSKIFNLISPIVNFLPEHWRIQCLYLYKHQRFSEINRPASFNEKIQWRKLNDHNEIFPILADKIRVKTFISELCLDIVVPSILWEGDNLIDVSQLDLPESYVIKANHASGTNKIVRNGEHIDRKALLALEKEWKSLDLSKTFVEWGYAQIPIKFFVEEFLDFEQFVPLDYKFWVFNGRVEFVQVDTDRFLGHKRAFYDRSWNKLPFGLTFPIVEEELIMPRNFKKMISSAESIAGELDFVRVDLYSDNEQVYFGEVTMYPDSGYGKFFPRSADKYVGKYWDLDV